MEDLGKTVESSGNIEQKLIQKNRFIPKKNYADPRNFAKFGSAEKYYKDSFDRITGQYPYDGSLSERTQYLNNSTYLDLYIFDNEYPRTTGYAKISPAGWGTQVSEVLGVGLPSTIEYIQVIGGPHTASGGMVGKDLTSTFENSNVYDPSAGRESNLKFDFNRGVTVETWIKKDSLIPSADSIFEFIFHLTNDETGMDTSGSISVVMNTVGALPSDTPLELYFISGTVNGAITFSDITNQELVDGQWHHIAVTAQNSGSDVVAKAYLDGSLKSTQISVGNAIEQVTGSLIANIGASRPYSYGALSGLPEGSGKLSGSIDEFRFWKTQRSSEEIGRYWFTQYGGGTNTDNANTDLGVYLKFNEGITGDLATDAVALDYSGRISNGTWVGYTPEGRSTGSAIDSHLGKESEFKDPIIYPFHPDVDAKKQSFSSKGASYDLRNNSSFYYNMPSWIIEEDDASGQELLKLSQILSSYLDTLNLQIESYPKLKDISYPSESSKPQPFNYKLLEGFGLTTSEIFVDANILEQIANRSEDEKYELDLTDIKNLIYKNIYNNLVYIYKSKGSMKAFRNLMRCYGIDTDLVKINLYGDNTTYRFRDNFETRSTRKKYIDFNSPQNFQGTLYQQTSSGNPNSVSFITGSGFVDFSKEGYTGLTLEAEAIFPRKAERSSQEYFTTNFLSSSLFGYHTANPVDPTDFTWPSLLDDSNISVYAVRDELESKNVKFVFESAWPAAPFSLETDIFYDVYENEKWNFAVRVRPDTLGADIISGSSSPPTDPTYTIELYGVNSDAGVVKNEFLLATSSIDIGLAAHLVQPKRIYAGAHRENFTGSVIDKTDIKLGSVKYWANYLNNEVIRAHSRDPENFGTYSPGRNTYLYPTELSGIEVPQMDTLGLHWSFDTLTGSDALGKTHVPDLSSGSLELSSRYGPLGPIVNLQHTAEGAFFATDSSKILDTRFVYSGKQTIPENIYSDDMVNIDQDDNLFKLSTRPVEYFFAIEKSMYQSISEEILNIFATIVDFNTLIGDPVNRYRQDYKQLQKLRQLFFERIKNEPDLDKYIDFYKWIDNSLSDFLNQLIPASAKFSDNMRTMVESHVLERSKYWTKFPTLDYDLPDLEAGLKGVNELLYDYETGHWPTSDDQNDNCFWWKNRAERDDPTITSGDADVDSNRTAYLQASLQVLNRSYTTPYRFSVQKQDINVGGSNFYENKSLNYVKNTIPWLDRVGGSTGVYVTSSSVEHRTCKDKKNPNEKRKLIYGAYTDTAGMNNSSNPLNSTSGKGDRYVPFSIYSASYVNSYAQDVVSALGHNIDITNIHDDSYGSTIGTPLQGPFTEKFVGGRQVRHIDLNESGLDSRDTRPESWQIKTSTGVVKLARQPVGRPRAMLYRDQIAKRPVNIRNIKQVANSQTGFVSGTLISKIGNYEKDYEVVQAVGGRTANNRAWVKNGPWNLNDEPDLGSSPLTASLYIGGMYDELKPERPRSEHIFVCRFSAPGGPDTMGDSRGGPGLDRYAAELSPNNDLNWRNNEVRGPLKSWLLTPHVAQFGYYSGVESEDIPGSTVSPGDYSGTGSFYQINRNTRMRLRLSGASPVTSSVYDNYYVQHPIPATDLRYSWITSSLEAIYPAGFQYWPKNFYVPSLTNPTEPPVEFVTASIQTYSMPADFVGMNNLVYSPIPEQYTLTNVLDSNEAQNFNYEDIASYSHNNITTIPGPYEVLNVLNLHRNGPYQYPSWKQVRTGQAPIARYLRRNNFLGCTGTRLAKAIDVTVSGTISSRTVEETVTNFFYEPAVQNVSVPLEVAVSTNASGPNGGCSGGSIFSSTGIHELGVDNSTEIPDYRGKTEEMQALRNVSLGVSIINTYGFANPALAECAEALGEVRQADVQFMYSSAPQKQHNQRTKYNPGCLSSDSAYGPIIDMIKQADNPKSVIQDFIETIYTDKTYPSPLNKFRIANRKRTNYSNKFFRKSRKTRTIDGYNKF